MSNPEKMLAAYDNALLGILQHEGKLESFLDVMFGFLCRRTDFFLIMKSETQKYGFPPGVAEKMVLGYFKKYQKLVLETQAQQASKSLSKNAEQTPESSKVNIEHNPEIQVELNEIQSNNVPSSEVENASEDIKSDNTPSNSETSENKSSKSSTLENSPGANHADSAQSVNQETSQPSTSTSEADVTVETKDKQSVFQSNPDSYNGAIRDKYCWSQNYDDVDVKIPVEKSVARAKQLMIEIQRKHLKVLVKKSEKSSEYDTIINDELQHEVNREESMWSLESGKHITITLTKDKNIWWSMLLKSEEEIDIQKIAPERSMADMDEEERAVINKLQFDDRQKKLGLPQSHELKVHEMLKKGWDAEGSPFKGQNFDPKMFNISPGAVDM